MERAKALPTRTRGRAHGFVHLSGQPGRWQASATLKDPEGGVLRSSADVWHVETATEAALWAAWRVHTAAHDLHVRDLELDLNDEAAVRILSHEAAVPDSLARAYFRARASAHRVGRVRFRLLASGMAPQHPHRPAPQPSENAKATPEETLTLF